MGWPLTTDVLELFAFKPEDYAKLDYILKKAVPAALKLATKPKSNTSRITVQRCRILLNRLSCSPVNLITERDIRMYAGLETLITILEAVLGGLYNCQRKTLMLAFERACQIITDNCEDQLSIPWEFNIDTGTATSQFRTDYADDLDWPEPES
jgi:hypothetical protein